MRIIFEIIRMGNCEPICYNNNKRKKKKKKVTKARKLNRFCWEDVREKEVIRKKTIIKR